MSFFPGVKVLMVITVLSVGVLDVSHSMLNYDSIIFTAAVVLSVSLWRKLWAA